tara:strand:- start:796 stop:2190 length:1395 start_codon:yes stop_codon:yes gene_type:complete
MSYNNYTIEEVRERAEQKNFTVFSTFSGGGGSSTGYKLAGGDVRGVLEFQRVGMDTYLKNYPGTPNFCKDIRKVTGQQVLDKLNMKAGDLDIFDGSPPCPPFSMSGSKRKGWNKTKTVYGFKQTNIEDLSFDVARMVHIVRPKVFICENVKGMTMEYAVDHFQSIMDAFSDSNAPYWTKERKESGWPEKESPSRYEVGWKVLNAKNYGVPQGRERVFIIGIRDNVFGEENLSPRIRVDVYGDETRKIIEEDSLKDAFPDPLEDQPTMRHAIGDMGEQTDVNNEEHKEIMELMKKQGRWKYLTKMEKNVKKYIDLGASVYQGKLEEWEAMSDEEKEANPKFCWENKDTKEKVYQKDKPSSEGNWKNNSYVKYSGFQVRRVPWDKPSHTLTERGLQTGTSAHLHPGEDRGFTSWEARRIMSLPGDYHLDGTLDERLARIGLMVAPLQMYHLSKHVYETYLRGYNGK